MEREIVSKDCSFSNHFELLYELVDTFMPATNAAPNSKHLRILIMNHTAWNLDSCWVFSNIAIIRFHSLSFVEHLLQCVSKAHDIWPVATRKGTHQPNNPAREDAHTNLIPEPMRIELLGVPRLWNSLALLVTDRHISAVNRNQTVITNVSNLPVLPNDLL